MWGLRFSRTVFAFYLYRNIFWVSTFFFFFPPSQAKLKSRRGDISCLKKSTQVFLSSFQIHSLKLRRLLKLSQQAETRKAGKKPSFSERTEPGEDGKICLYGELAPFHLVLGLAEETQVGKVTFEPGPNEAQGSWLSLLSFTSSLKSYLSKKENCQGESRSLDLFCLNPGGSHCLCWRGL